MFIKNTQRSSKYKKEHKINKLKKDLYNNTGNKDLIKNATNILSKLIKKDETTDETGDDNIEELLKNELSN
jgi:hypothetical protein